MHGLLGDFRDFVSEIGNIFGLNRKYWLIIDIIAVGLGAILHYTELYLWSPAEAYFIILLLIWADFGSATWYSVRAKRYETRKSIRIVYKMVAYTVILFFAHNLAKYEKLLVWLPEAVFIPMVVVLLLSLVKNLSLLGLVSGRLAEILYNNIDKYKNATDVKISDNTPLPEGEPPPNKE